MSRQAKLQAVRAKIAALEAGSAGPRPVLPFGDPGVDGCLPGGGLPLGCWHEIAGDGLEAETGAAGAAFLATLAAPLAARGAMVWVMRRDDLFAPGLAGLGFPGRRLIQVLARDDDEALAALEDALGTAGVAAAVGEIETVDLTAGRRLQLACERRGAAGFVLRRRPFARAAGREPAGSAAATRWRVASAPSVVGDLPGLGAPRWRVALERCRGGRTGEWLMEKNDGAHPLRLVAGLGDRELAPAQPFALSA
jgi:protein ImuA